MDHQTNLPSAVYDEIVTENSQPVRRSIEEEGNSFDVDGLTKAKITRGRLAEDNPNVRGVRNVSIVSGVLALLIVIFALSVFVVLAYWLYCYIRRHFLFYIFSNKY